MWSLSLQRMHSNMVPFAFRSALRYGPFRLLGCTPMWSETLFGVHYHLVLITFKNALRSGPPLYKVGFVFPMVL